MLVLLWSETVRVVQENRITKLLSNSKEPAQLAINSPLQVEEIPGMSPAKLNQIKGGCVMITAKDVQGVMAMMPSFGTKDAGDLNATATIDVDNLQSSVDRIIKD